LNTKAGKGPGEPKTIRLYDTPGQQVATVHEGTLEAAEEQRAQVDVSSLSSGTHFLHMDTPMGRHGPSGLQWFIDPVHHWIAFDFSLRISRLLSEKGSRTRQVQIPLLKPEGFSKNTPPGELLLRTSSML
jgi:hypothetical protein